MYTIDAEMEEGAFSFYATVDNLIACHRAPFICLSAFHLSNGGLVYGGRFVFPLSEIPTVLQCPECGHNFMEIDLTLGTEILVADALDAKIAPRQTPAFDVYDSKLFPGLTFQIKYSNPTNHISVLKKVKGRVSVWDESPTWTWSEERPCGADWYILFGIKDSEVYPFAVPVRIWKNESANTGIGGRILKISTDEYSHCGRYENAFKHNKFWQYSIQKWPEGLLSRLGTRQLRMAF